MRNVLLAVPLALALAGSAAAQHSGHAAPANTKVNGIVQKVDADTGKITLKHDAIPSLSMDAMTMVWTVKDPAKLQGLKTGDKVKFEAEIENGQNVVTGIEKAR
jgi:Cu/Ag efflux protein CusF